MQSPVPGQRWISTSEPALGLGIVLTSEFNRVELHFPAAEETRLYALDSAPLVRVRFKPGDTIADADKREFLVTKVSEEEQIITYHGEGIEIPESHLLDTLSFTSPSDRLLAGMCDDPRDFDLRVKALGWNAKLRQSDARGFTGARIDLIPHQLAIVAETANRLHPRVLLADEVGLGKTIEACLILHRLHLTGRADRILIIVPEPLVHQWFVELLRRFNLLFAIFDEARCVSLDAGDPEGNPFLDSQLILCASSFFTDNLDRAAQAREAGFDMLIVDEAHHLEWSPEESSTDYTMVESLAEAIPSLLLLTATPQQLGPAGHFARLRLLDPDRYGDLDAFLKEADSYAPLAAAIEALQNGELPDDIKTFADKSERASALLGKVKLGQETARKHLIAELIDTFGTGRVLFRNTREQLTGFPERKPNLHPLEPGSSPYNWLADLVRSLPEDEKILLITGSPDAAIGTQEKLLEQMNVEVGLFHEDLSLLERDRNAAYFAEPEGARILICSEIGSEGRNFQFARHLVLFGLPRDPELLEQRIGRLDRIGQTGTINIHVPYGVDSGSELHARWLQEGIDAFTQPLKGATKLANELLPGLDELEPDDKPAFDAFLKRSRQLKDEIIEELATGHDRLLELGAPAPEKASDLLETIEKADEEPSFERFTIRLFDKLGLKVNDLALRSYILKRSHRLSEAFADLPEDGLSITFDRDNALAREDLTFMTADHPMLTGAIDHLLSSEYGNASYARWETGKGKAVLIECCFVLEALAPNRLHVDRFLPPTSIRVMVDHSGTDLSDKPKPTPLQPGDARRLVNQPTFRKDLLPKLLQVAETIADKKADPSRKAARKTAKASITAEIERLKDLAKRNPQVNESEITALEGILEETIASLKSPRLRLDSLRVIWRT
ncbi:helicase-related protein [Haloferula sp.]|uniref:helicase-related protein n=1 Tax=Haloferula sp. TaxID=2497595 RepID=UPI00329B07D7